MRQNRFFLQKECIRGLPLLLLFIFVSVPGYGSDLILLDGTKGPGSNWKDQFPGDVSSGATLTFNGRDWTLTGTSRKEMWGRVYQQMDVDLDRYTDIILNVKTISRQGYVVVVSDKIDGGYKRIGDITQPGILQFSLKDKTGLKGKQKIQIELGVVDEGGGDNLKATMTMSEIRLVDSGKSAPEPGEPATNGRPAKMTTQRTSLYNNMERDPKSFKDKWGDVPSGAAASVEGNGNLKIAGTKKSDKWGCVYVDMPIDFDHSPALVLQIDKIAGEGYLILKHSTLSGGFVRLTPAPTEPGEFKYDLKGLLKGKQAVEFEFGVANPAGPDATGAAMELTRVDIVEQVAQTESSDRPAANAVDDAGAHEELEIDTLVLISTDRAAGQVKEFKDAWNGASSGAKASVEDGKFTIAGSRTTDIWGCVFRDVEIPFENDPVLQLDIAAIAGEGYMILKGEGIPDGYVKLNPSPAKPGRYEYRLSDFTPFKQKKVLELQIGVVNPAGPTSIGAKMSIASLNVILKKKRQ